VNTKKTAVLRMGMGGRSSNTARTNRPPLSRKKLGASSKKNRFVGGGPLLIGA
jgi:hypothetical protein